MKHFVVIAWLDTNLCFFEFEYFLEKLEQAALKIANMF